MILVLDASVAVAALVDAGAAGQWAEHVLTDADLVAPQHLPAEVFQVLRRLESAGTIGAEAAALARDATLSLPVELVSFAAFAGRIAELRHAVTTYDAWYVAVAEALGAPLATLDARLARAPGPTCRFRLPELG